jgi:flavin reductase (DIM6/NTAB) family NADH-FMN oxidoreductase RutF
MDAGARKTVLRMIPYGLYVATAAEPDGAISAATVNWVTQVSFEPPLVAVALKVGSGVAHAVKASGAMGLNVLGRDQAELATTFFKPTTHDDERISGERYRLGKTGAPLLETVAACVEGEVRETVERGDHTLFVIEVVEASVREQPKGRPDEASLWLRELGPRVFYGG